MQGSTRKARREGEDILDRETERCTPETEGKQEAADGRMDGWMDAQMDGWMEHPREG